LEKKKKVHRPSKGGNFHPNTVDTVTNIHTGRRRRIALYDALREERKKLPSSRAIGLREAEFYHGMRQRSAPCGIAQRISSRSIGADPGGTRTSANFKKLQRNVSALKNKERPRVGRV